MFGYLKPNFQNAPKTIRKQYKSIYCGLCHALNKHYGFRGMACLNNETVFLLLLIISVEDRKIQTFHGSCSITPFVRVPFIDYLGADCAVAAALTILVADYEVKDNIKDEKKVFWKIAGYLLDKKSREAKEELSVFENNIYIRIKDFYACERDKQTDFETMVQACGKIFASIIEPMLAYVDSPVASTISCIANKIGQWIYLIDAFDDYSKDKSNGNCNPLLLITDSRIAIDMIENIQDEIQKLVLSLPLNQFRDLVLYFTNECLPYTSHKVIVKFKGKESYEC